MRRPTSRPHRALLIWTCAAALVLSASAWQPRVAPSTALGRFDLRRRAARQVVLPAALHEVSGLAADALGTVYAHADERGVLHQLHVPSGRILRSIPVGSPPVRADFEGIAVVGRQLVVMTSDGQLYSATVGDDGIVAPFTRTDTGLGKRCELEGLAFDAARDLLLIGCKLPVRSSGPPHVTVFRWSRAASRLAQPEQIVVPMTDIERASGVSRFHPSGVEVDPVSGHYLLLAGRERALVEITPDGNVLAGAQLTHSLHGQPEGLTLLGDSLLLIADEGARRRPTLTAYRRVR